MLTLSLKLRERAQQLGISNAEVARRVGLSERRYAHYVSGAREPDLTTLIKIATVLGTTPNWLMDVAGGEVLQPDPTNLLLERLNLAARTMSPQALKMTVLQAEAVAAYSTRAEG